MAEERLFDLDEDKDKKYKIRVNEDGEEELVIEGADSESNGAEEKDSKELYEIPEIDEDDEEAAVLTPEQYAARLEQRRREAEENAKKFNLYFSRAKELLGNEDFSGALQEIERAEEYETGDGGLSALKLLAVTKNFTDFSAAEDCAEAADSVAENCTAEQKSELAARSERLVDKIADLRREVEALRLENEEKRSERRKYFKDKRRGAMRWFLATALPLVAFVCLFAAFFTVRYTLQDGTYMVVTIVFGVLSVVAFVATLLTGRRLWAVQRNISLNEKNSSTKLGREYEEKNAELELMRRVRRSVKEER